MFDRVLDYVRPEVWTHLFIVSTVLCTVLVIFVMQMISHEREDMVDPKWLQWIRRFGYTVTASSGLFSIDYYQSHVWQPWPPVIFLLWGVIIGAIVRIVAVQLRIKREGHRREALPMASAFKRWL